MKPNTFRDATLACEASNSRWISEIVDSELFSLELCSSKFSIFWESSKISASFSDRAASFRAITWRNFELAFSRPVILSSRRRFSASKTSVFCCSRDRSLFGLKKIQVVFWIRYEKKKTKFLWLFKNANLWSVSVS